jgi:hypothetical protein
MTPRVRADPIAQSARATCGGHVELEGFSEMDSECTMNVDGKAVVMKH